MPEPGAAESSEPWAEDTPGLVTLPSGRRVRGRGLSRPRVGQEPTLALEFTGRPAEPPPWERIWVRWPDFWLPADYDAALAALRRALEDAAVERVEISCAGGIGRTGTGLAALGVLEGRGPAQALAWVRSVYHPRAVEMLWQRRFLRYAANHR